MIYLICKYDKNNKVWQCFDKNYLFYENQNVKWAWFKMRKIARKHCQPCKLLPNRKDHDLCTYYP